MLTVTFYNSFVFLPFHFVFIFFFFYSYGLYFYSFLSILCLFVCLFVRFLLFTQVVCKEFSIQMILNFRQANTNDTTPSNSQTDFPHHYLDNLSFMIGCNAKYMYVCMYVGRYVCKKKSEERISVSFFRIYRFSLKISWKYFFSWHLKDCFILL